MKQFANLICFAIHNRPVREVPSWLLSIAAYCGDILKIFGYLHPPLTSFRLNNLRTQMVYDFSNLEDIVGSLPYDLNEGVMETLKWLKCSNW